jgi:hypothetical protein
MNNRNVFLIVLESGKYKIMAAVDLVSGESCCAFSRWDLLPILQRRRTLCAHVAEGLGSQILHETFF